jgi:hypothetical protein
MSMRLNRRRLLAGIGLSSLGLLVVPGIGLAQLNKPLVEVWKSPTCGCCKEWMTYLEANGFRVKGFDTGNNAKRIELGMPKQYGSCHTALVDGYVIEGHVPAREIHRLLKERPKAIGLSVPEMPIGSPGMDGPDYGGQVDPYDVILVQANGKGVVYGSYRTKKGGRG